MILLKASGLKAAKGVAEDKDLPNKVPAIDSAPITLNPSPARLDIMPHWIVLIVSAFLGRRSGFLSLREIVTYRNDQKDRKSVV